MNTIKHIINFNVLAIAASVSLDNVLVCYQHLQDLSYIIWDFVPYTLATEILCIYVIYIIINTYRTDIKWSEIA